MTERSQEDRQQNVEGLDMATGRLTSDAPDAPIDTKQAVVGSCLQLWRVGIGPESTRPKKRVLYVCFVVGSLESVGWAAFCAAKRVHCFAGHL